MGVRLLNGAGPSTTGNWVDTHSIASNRIRLRVTAYGAFAGSPVIIEHSPDAGATAVQLGTLATGNDLLVEYPVDLVRARTDASLTGSCNVMADISG